MTVRIITGDNRVTLPTLEAGSVQTVVTSPPYHGLRDYGHEGQIGLEETPDEYVAALVGVFREVRRVLRNDGTLWLNLGDSYAANEGQRKATDKPGQKQATSVGSIGAPSRAVAGLAAKNLIGIPWRVAFALQADGWYLRSDIIWHKPNPMPESVTDRPTKAHEYLFLLAKSERYHYDATAISEPFSDESWIGRNPSQSARVNADRNDSGKMPTTARAARNSRSVWTVATQPYKGAHFATMPRDLVEPCILAGSARQACETCGAAWIRNVEKWRTFESGSGKSGNAIAGKNVPDSGGETKDVRRGPTVRTTTLGFSPGCKCETNTGSARSLVLDPFGGAGTTGLVAEGLGRDAVLCELNPRYADMGRERINGPLFSAHVGE